MLVAMTLPALAAGNSAQRATGAVVLSDGTRVSQKPDLPRLNLTNQQREMICKSVASQHADVEFRLKSTKSAKSFTPKVGAKLPKGVKPYGLPSEVLGKLPKLRRSAEQFAAEYRRASTHTNFEMASLSYLGCVRQMEEIFAGIGGDVPEEDAVPPEQSEPDAEERGGTIID